MIQDVINADELTPLAKIADLMETKQIKRVPVIHNGRVAGVISRTDLLKMVACGGIRDTDEDRDCAIRERLFAELRQQSGQTRRKKTSSSRTGVIHLWRLETLAAQNFDLNQSRVSNS